jgi:diguanylate cyclase (GGDEF)-like protein
MSQVAGSLHGTARSQQTSRPWWASLTGWLRRHERLPARDALMLLPECAVIIGFIAVIWAGIWLMLSQQYEAAESAAVRDSGNLARAFEENTERIVAGVDQILLSMRTDYARNPATFDLLDWQRQHTRSDRFTVQFGMAGADGFTRGSTLGRDAGKGIDVSDREHFRVHLDPTRDELFISKPLIGRGSGKTTVQFTRKLIGPGGRFAGILLVSLGCEELSRFYDTLDLGNGVVVLAGTDGIVRARGPLRDDVIGSDMSSQKAFTQYRAAKQGHYWTTGRWDNTNRIISFRRLPDLPLLVLVGFDADAVFQSYRHVRTRSIFIGSIATDIVLLLGTLWIVLRRRWITSKRQLQLTFETVNQGIVMVDANGHASVVNRRALQLLGLPMEMLQQPKSIDWPMQPVGLPAQAPDGSSAASLTVSALGTAEIIRNDGRVIEVQSYPTSFGDTVLTYTDVTERKLAETRILHVAHHDALTGLPNRLLLNEHIEEAVAQVSKRSGHFAVFGLDLDGFKTINDTMGHDAGDLVLCRFAERLRLLVRPDDIAARTGGDEFIVLVRDLGSPATADAVAQRLIDGLALPVDLGGSVSTLDSCVGIAVFPEDGIDGRTLLKNADTALYRAKAMGKGSICHFEKWMDQSLLERRALELDLRQALDRNELDVYFQPEFSCGTLQVVGFEALVRWQHATRGFVPPDVFIPIAEECGLIATLGAMVLEKACGMASKWRPRHRIAVNLSPVQFRGGGLVPLLADILVRTGFSAEMLELEITEGVLIKDEEQAINSLRALKELGVSIALDDFGTGYSSLSYLRRFPFDKIKIDKSFVRAQEHDTGTRTIMEAVLAMSSRLNLPVIAEGVETKEQLTMLRSQGCPEVQGFLLGRPMPEADVLEFIRSLNERDGRHLRLAASNPALPKPAETCAA